MSQQRSIVRRLIFSVLIVESLAALALVAAIALHEYHLQLASFQASLHGSAESLLGAVQEAQDSADDVALEAHGLHLGSSAIYRVQDERGRVLGSAGTSPYLNVHDQNSAYETVRTNGENYRFIRIDGIRRIDPGRPDGGVVHRIAVVYGEPLGHVWHEVFEAIRFSVFAAILLLAATSLMLIFAVRRVLHPLHDLTQEASRVSATNWNFTRPDAATRTTELAPLADALSDAIARLQISFAQQKRLTNDAAHELKTDVAIVKSSLQLLGMKLRTQDEYRRGLEKSISDIGRLEKTLQAMLTLARLEQVPTSKPAQCQLREVIEESIHQCAPYAEMRGILLTSVLHDDPQVGIDRSDALLLCSNLIMNAMQHSAKDQVVDVHLEMTGVSKARLTVKDSGTGIAIEDMPFLFDAFYRGDASRSRKSGGTGLGLAICKAICDRANGTISISSNAEQGTTATVELPENQP